MLAWPATADTPTRTDSSPTSYDGVIPFILDPAGPGGNVSCDMLGYEYTSGRINYNGDFDGEFPAGIDVTVTGGTFVAWTSTFGIGAVIVKGGNDANIYEYESASLGDSDLASPPTSSGDPAGLSNLTFCFDDLPFVPAGAVTVEKTAVPSFTRTHEWDIDKKVETDNGLELEDGTPKIWLYTDGEGDETATWTVDVTYEGYEDSAWKLDGEITATNTGNVGAQIRNWTDSQVFTGNVSIRNCRNDVTSEPIASVFNYVIPVGESVTCDYLVDPANPEVTENTATVGGWFVLGGAVDSVDDAVGRFSERDTATYDWDTPTTVINETVNVKDISDLFGTKNLGSVTEPKGDTFTYDKDFAWEDFGRDKCGSFTYDNTATIVETDQFASATLKVNVQCFEGETAWAADGALPGFLRYTELGNWATYIDAQDLPKSGSIFAGQTIPVGSYDLSVASVLDITLTAPWVLEPGEESVKIQGYDEAPSGNPAPGLFTTYKGSELKGIQLDGSDFYGIHLDVEQPDPDFGP